MSKTSLRVTEFGIDLDGIETVWLLIDGSYNDELVRELAEDASYQILDNISGRFFIRIYVGGIGDVYSSVYNGTTESTTFIMGSPLAYGAKSASDRVCAATLQAVSCANRAAAGYEILRDSLTEISRPGSVLEQKLST